MKILLLSVALISFGTIALANDDIRCGDANYSYSFDSGMKSVEIRSDKSVTGYSLELIQSKDSALNLEVYKGMATDYLQNYGKQYIAKTFVFGPARSSVKIFSYNSITGDAQTFPCTQGN